MQKTETRPIPKLSIRFVYENGLMRPLDPVDFREGEEVVLTPYNPLVVADIIKAHTRQYSIVGLDSVEDEDALQRELDEALQGVTLSDAIIEERHAG